MYVVFVALGSSTVSKQFVHQTIYKTDRLMHEKIWELLKILKNKHNCRIDDRVQIVEQDANSNAECDMKIGKVYN